MVSTPLDWEEVKTGLDRYDFTIDTIRKRLRKKGDLWQGLFDKKNTSANNHRLANLSLESSD